MSGTARRAARPGAGRSAPIATTVLGEWLAAGAGRDRALARRPACSAAPRRAPDARGRPPHQAGFGRAGMFRPRTTAGRSRKAARTRCDVGEVGDADQLAGAVELDQVVDPREGGDVGDRVVVAGEPGALAEAPVDHREQPLRLGDVAVARPLVLVVLAGELVEEADLAEHRPDPAHLEHQPLDRRVAAGRVGGHAAGRTCRRGRSGSRPTRTAAGACRPARSDRGSPGSCCSG